MKILHVTQNYFPSKGGTQETIKKVSEYLHEDYQDEVTVFTTNSYYGPNNRLFKKIDIEDEWINNIYIKRFEFLKAHKPFLKILSKLNRQIGGKDLAQSLVEWNAGPFSRTLQKAIQKSQADVICASSVHYRFANYGINRKKLKNPKPFVLYGALHLENKRIPEIYFKRIKAADHYIANTIFEKSFLENHGIESGKITVAGAGIDFNKNLQSEKNIASLKDKLDIPGYHKIILCISRHEAFKGLSLLLNAFKKVINIDKNVHLIIAGADGNNTNALIQEKEKIKSLLVFKNISSTFKNQLLSMADMIVLPSKEESFGTVFLEAWQFKKPVIGAGIGAISSIIDAYKNGLLFKPDDMIDLCEKIEYLLQHPNNARSMGNAGYLKLAEYYTWQTITERFREAYIKAIEIFQSKNGKLCS